jgi:hydroxyacyl-ACP dehydratase HTD2-like protein with hotdog domain
MYSWTRPAHRFLSTSSLNLQALDAWIASPKSLELTDTFHSNHLSDLYITLPTRDGTRGRPFTSPVEGTPLGYGHHLAFFHPRNPEAQLRTDGTDADFCPPEPFTRRMWAGGTMTWNKERALKVGEKATAVSTVAKVEKKGFEAGKPMVFVKQRIEVTVEGRSEPGMVEERAHVYQASVGSVGSRVPRQGESPQRPVTYLGVDADTFNQ